MVENGLPETLLQVNVVNIPIRLREDHFMES